MTKKEAIKVLRTESVEIGGNAVSVCRFLEALDMAISALRQQERFGDVNKALTLDELQKMDGEPVYIVDGDVAWWDIVSFSVQDWLYLAREEELRYSRYGEWLAYRRKPEEGTV